VEARVPGQPLQRRDLVAYRRATLAETAGKGRGKSVDRYTERVEADLRKVRWQQNHVSTESGKLTPAAALR